MFDLAVLGGNIIDPDAGTIRRADIGISAGRIAAIEGAMDSDRAHNILDATGTYVTPGLVDMHAHVNWRTHPAAIEPNAYSAATGVTTWVDAGSADATSIEALREYVMAPSAVRVLSLLRLEHPIPDVVDTASHARSDPKILAAVAKLHEDVVIGLKVSMGQCEMESLHLVLEAAELAGLPVMVHIAQVPPDVTEILPLLRRGDSVTHAFTGQTMRLVDGDGGVLPEALRARERGVLFDVGHGAGSFSWDVAERMMAAGFGPDTISTDSWQVSVRGPMFDLPTCLSKFLHLGMSLVDVVRAATIRPAAVVGRSGEFGTLRAGAQADLAILRLERGVFPLYDTSWEVRDVNQLLRAQAVLVAGRVLPGRTLPKVADWLQYALTHDGHDPNSQGGVRPAVREFQEELIRRGHTPDQMAPRQTVSVH